MVSAIVRKSYRDLSKKKARTFFTIVTIALGVMGMSLFAVEPLADRGVLEEMDKANMANVRVTVNDINLTMDNIIELEGLDNIDEVETRAIYLTKVKIGNRWNNAIMLGLVDYNDQKVDHVYTSSGDTPTDFQVLSENGNSINGIHDWKKGTTITVKDSSGIERSMAVTGVGKSMTISGATTEGFAVFYSTVNTIRQLSGIEGYNLVSFDLKKTEDADIESTIEDIRNYLSDPEKVEEPVVAFANLPEVRKNDEWPGSEFLDQLMGFMYTLTILSLLASVFLISNTMNTIISEQKKEIAQMKAIGATKNQVFRSYLLTSGIMGFVGATIGAVMGIFITYFVLNTLGRPFGFEIDLMVHFPTVILSFFVGIGLVIGASMPALIRSSGVPVREGLESHGIAGAYGKGGFDRLLLRTKKMPRTVQMGLRNISRKKGRSASTIIQVAMAVGVFLGLVTFGYSLQIAVSGAWADRSFDILTYHDGSGGKTMTEDMAASFYEIDGIEAVEPFMITGAQIGERNVEIWGYVQDTTSWDYGKTMSKGRWFSQDDHEQNRTVLVIGEALAEFEDLEVGDNIPVMTATGEFEFTIIGLQSSLMDNGQSVQAPLSTLQHVLQKNNTVSGFFIHTTSKDHDDIDRVSTMVEEHLLDKGFVVNNQIHYVMEERNKVQNQGIMDLFMIISLLVVFISMIGLMSTLTMNILERTKEIGMMRCIGSKANDIRLVFGSEGIFLALIGWIIGIPAGYMIGYYISMLVEESMKLTMTFYFPLIYLFWSFIIAMIGTILIIQAPLFRAVRFKPGDALRYQ